MAVAESASKPRKKRHKWTATELKALPWPKRVRIVRGLIAGTERAHVHLAPEEAFAMCIRKTWPKGRAWVSLRQCAESNRHWRPTGERDRIGQTEKCYDDGPLASGTPAGVYRLAYLVQPKRVDFSDMYKCRLFRIFSPDRRFMCSVELFKFELTLYFYCRRADMFVPKEPALPEVFRAQPENEEEAKHWHDEGTGGWAKLIAANIEEWESYLAARDAYQWQGVIEPSWASDLVACKSSAGRAWMAMIVEAANRGWHVYPGNDFEV